MSRTVNINFGYNARTVYTCVKRAMTECGEFRDIKCDERTFRISASHGLPIFGEDIVLKTVATSPDSCEVKVKSSDKLFYNIFKWGNNKRNVGNIVDFIRNEVYRLLPVTNDYEDSNHSQIRIVKPDIKFRN